MYTQSPATLEGRRAWQESKRHDPEYQTKLRDKRLQKLYGITLAQYDAILAAQGGACGMCRKPPGKKHLAVDHDHECCPGKTSCGGCVRGLLCMPCNVALGFIESAKLRALADKYLADFL